MFRIRSTGADCCGMSTFFKVMLALLVTLPVGAYFAGSVVASQGDAPDDTRLVRVEHSASPDEDPSPAPPRPAQRRATPVPRSDAPDEGSSEEGDGEGWRSEHDGLSDESDESDSSNYGDQHSDDGDHEDHEDDE